MSTSAFYLRPLISQTPSKIQRRAKNNESIDVPPWTNACDFKKPLELQRRLASQADRNFTEYPNMDLDKQRGRNIGQLLTKSSLIPKDIQVALKSKPTAQPPASHRALFIGEVIERILVCLFDSFDKDWPNPIIRLDQKRRNLLKAYATQLVCKRWHQALASSRRLRQRMFLEPCYTRTEPVVRINHLLCDSGPIGDRALTKDWDGFGCDYYLFPRRIGQLLCCHVLDEIRCVYKRLLRLVKLI
jgi:hypothetical protein